VPSEGLFSLGGGNVYEEHRHRILPEHAETLQFIQGNYSFYANKYGLNYVPAPLMLYYYYYC